MHSEAKVGKWTHKSRSDMTNVCDTKYRNLRNFTGIHHTVPTVSVVYLQYKRVPGMVHPTFSAKYTDTK